MSVALLRCLQLFLNALKENEMRISDLNMLIMDECHHTILNHPYNAIMEAYYTTCRQNSSAPLPQIIGLTASLGVGASDDPQSHYVRICANLDCECITYVRRPENVEELLRLNPRPQRDQIVPVQPRDMAAEFATEVMMMMRELMTLQEMKVIVSHVPHELGTQPFENWAVQVNSRHHCVIKADIALPGNPISQLRDVTCHMGSQCYLPPDTSEHTLP